MNMVPFQEMPYARPDMEALKAAYQQAIEKLRSAATYEEARSAFFTLQDAEEQRATMAVLCSVRNTIDTTDAYYDGEMKWLREQNACVFDPPQEGVPGGPGRQPLPAPVRGGVRPADVPAHRRRAQDLG